MTMQTDDPQGTDDSQGADASRRADYRAIFDFIAKIGLDIREASLPDDTFLPGIVLREGGLLVDPQKLRWPGDLLHEAGHLAVLPADVRPQAHDDAPEVEGIAHAGELEAMAWAYAAAVELGLPMERLIHEGGYRGKSRELLQMYAFGVYPGLRGLCESGMTAAPGFASGADDVGDDIRYPRMRHWLRG